MSYLSGTAYDKDQVAQTAVAMGLLTREPDGTFSGLTASETERLIDSFGFDAHVESSSIAGLRQWLEAEPPAQVIVAVDSDEVWYRAPDDLTFGDAGADHALVVAGIDESRGTVILADPGNPDAGRGYEISLAEFENAWADSGHQMVVTTKPVATPPPLPSLTPEPTGDDGLVGAVTGGAMVIVPLLAASALRRVRMPRTRR